MVAKEMMEPARYDELFHEVERWVRKSRKLHLVATALTAQTSAAYGSFISDTEGIMAQSPQFHEKAEVASVFSDARALLFGLAIENAAIRIFLSQVRIHRGLPFNVGLPNSDDDLLLPNSIRQAALDSVYDD